MELPSHGSLELRFLDFTLLWNRFKYLYCPLSLGCQKFKKMAIKNVFKRVEMLKRQRKTNPYHVVGSSLGVSALRTQTLRQDP